MAWPLLWTVPLVAVFAIHTGYQAAVLPYLFDFRSPLRSGWAALDGGHGSPLKPLDNLADDHLKYHMGGNSPWIRNVHGVTEGSDGKPPPECRVDQVHMMSRHTERYPTVLAGIRMLELYQRIQHADVNLTGDLAFANDWDFFMRDPAERFEGLVATGPYAGTLDAFATGVMLRTRYEHLVEEALATNMTSFWASDSARVIETAKHVASGLYGLAWAHSAKLQIIPETSELGADTLTPSKTCLKYANNIDAYGRLYGVRMLYEWQSTYLPKVIARLKRQNPNFDIDESEVYTMQELCGFEMIAKGSSPWCSVFDEKEWDSFEYARDLLHYYRTGPGNPYSGAMGWLWLNATAKLLQDGPDAGPMFLSFVHDGDILPMLSALQLLPQSEDLPSTNILHNRTWRTSDVVPMGGRVLLERLACPAPQGCWDNADYGYPNHVYCEPSHDDYFVRINVNDAIFSLPGCRGGPGQSCPLSSFMARVTERGKEVGDFRETCGLAADAAAGISFLHQ